MDARIRCWVVFVVAAGCGSLVARSVPARATSCAICTDRGERFRLRAAALTIDGVSTPLPSPLPSELSLQNGEQGQCTAPPGPSCLTAVVTDLAGHDRFVNVSGPR
jgi:hypothetical protein